MKRALLSILAAGILLLGACSAPATAPAEEPGQIQPTPPAGTTEPVSPPTTEEAPPEKPPLTPAEQTYLSTTANQATTVGNALTELGKLLQSSQFGSEDWTLKTAIQLAIIRTAYNEAMELEPPNSLAHIHYKYAQAMKHYNTYTELLAQAIDELNLDLLDKATGELGAGNELIKETTQLMREFKETHK